MLAETLTNLIPPSLATEWTLSHLISLDHGEWQVNLSGEDGIAIGTGDSIEAAFAAASLHIAEGKIIPRYRVVGLALPEGSVAGALAGLLKPRVQGVVRRV